MAVIDQIILLQDVDNKLFEINKLLGDLPKQVQELPDQEEFTKNSLSKPSLLVIVLVPTLITIFFESENLSFFIILN